MGDTFTEGEAISFTGIPNFAPELFRRARLRDPLKMKALQKGLAQLSEEGATQFFRPLMSNDLILGAVGVLQFDVVAYRLKDEYGVDASFEQVGVVTARWVHCDDAKKLEEFREKNILNLGIDGAGELVYLAPSRVNLQLAQGTFPRGAFLRHPRARRLGRGLSRLRYATGCPFHLAITPPAASAPAGISLIWPPDRRRRPDFS